jgi:hypothetical protein
MCIPEVFLRKFEDHKFKTVEKVMEGYKILAQYQPHEVCTIRAHVQKHKDERRYKMLDALVNISDTRRSPWNRNTTNLFKKMNRALVILNKLHKEDENDVEVINCLRLYYILSSEPLEQVAYDIKFHHLHNHEEISIKTNIIYEYVCEADTLRELYAQQHADYKELAEKYSKLHDKYLKIKYAPDGVGYQKAKAHFENLANN